jgi:glycosyltransferase involved in cell wall biosynthesis
VICLTEFTAADAEERAGVPSERIRIVPSGVDDPGLGPDLLVQEAVLDRYGLTGVPFVLYPAITYAHKNHETLVAAFSLLARDRPDVRLVLTGAEGPFETVVRSAVSAYGVEDAVVRPGRIPEADLDVLYRHASLVAFPSRYEGFGLPVLEAMARGCPVVASDVAALPGVTGGAAVLVDPLDVGAWARAMADLLDDAGRRTVLARRGVEHAHRFRWPAAAAALAAVYRDVARASPHPLTEEIG